MLIALLLPSALAQAVEGGEMPPLNSQLFRPSVDAQGLLWLDDSRVQKTGTWTGRFLLSWTDEPLVFRPSDPDVDPVILVDEVVQANLLPGVALGPIRLGLDVPIYLRSTGQAGGETGLGDLGIAVKGQLLDVDDSIMGLALSGRLALPTSTMQAALGEEGVAADVGAIVDMPLGPVLFTANVGTRIRKGVELENATLHNQLLYGAGLGYGFNKRGGIGGELVGNAGLNELANGATNPLEALVSGWFRPTGGDLVFRLGVGAALTQGIGAPRSRLILSVGREPLPVYDRDLDGIVDELDECPTEPEDIDGWKDEDGCPDPTELTLFFVDADGVPVYDVHASVGGKETSEGKPVGLQPGQYVVSAEVAAFAPLEDSLDLPPGPPVERTYTLAMLPGTLIVTVSGPDGAPISAHVEVFGTGYDVQGQVSIEREPGPVRVDVSAPGYLSRRLPAQLQAGEETRVDVKLEKELAAVTAERIEIKDSVYFETAKTVIKSESFQLLDQVATILVDHPEITRLRVEGHTDSRGNDKYNLKLSKGRAASVMTYLIDHGVSADRLESEGFGETRPLDTANNAAAWAKNRRVDFYIVGTEAP